MTGSTKQRWIVAGVFALVLAGLVFTQMDREADGAWTFLPLILIWASSPFAALATGEGYGRIKLVVSALMALASLALYGKALLRPDSAYDALLLWALPLYEWVIVLVLLGVLWLLWRRKEGNTP